MNEKEFFDDVFSRFETFSTEHILLVKKVLVNFDITPLSALNTDQYKTAIDFLWLTMGCVDLVGTSIIIIPISLRGIAERKTTWEKLKSHMLDIFSDNPEEPIEEELFANREEDVKEFIDDLHSRKKF